ncbi:MAG: DUF819 family protein [Oliverpabstia sp.]|nr:DUF819 family protein [Lachnospiraceae bacterium]MDY5027479.1 DUF819 family protein [Oliverpabstia sp.]
MFPLFESSASMLAVILCMIALAFWLQKFKGFKTLGPALIVIILGIILVNLKIVPGYCDVYGAISIYCIPISMSLYLLNVDLKKILQMSKQPLLSIASAVFSVSLVAVLFGVLLGGKINEGWKVAGMFVGTYTGGSSNLTAIATGLNASADTIAAANAADYVIGMPTLILMFAAPAILKNSKKFQKLWPYSFTDEELEGDGETKELMEAEEWGIKDIAILLAIATSIVAVSTKLSEFFSADFASAGRILLISTLSIIVSQIPAVRKLKGAMNLGLFFGMMFLAVVGFSVDIRGFLGSALNITLLCFCVILSSIILHLVITRLLKIKYEYVLLGIVGAIADGTTSALVASGAKWKSLISIGLLMGIIGGVCGNYFGIAVAYLVRMIIGA